MSKYFWERSATEVAKSLRGLMLNVNDQQAIMIDVSAYERESEVRGLYKPMLEMQAGSVYCPRLMNSILLCIVTGKGETIGSRVRIDDIELDGRRYTGPGNVTEALGITVPKSTGSARLVNDLLVEIDIGAQRRRKASSKQVKEKKLRRESLLSEKGLARLMPQIVDRYLEDKPAISFDSYVNALLEECNTESELRRKIST